MAWHMPLNNGLFTFIFIHSTYPLSTKEILVAYDFVLYSFIAVVTQQFVIVCSCSIICHAYLSFVMLEHCIGWDC
jgi:hypothetical protein